MSGYVRRDLTPTQRQNLLDSMTIERYRPEATLDRQAQQLADLRQVIHILATAMNCRSDAA